ncbi:hypothetical protein CYMTET_52055 [Cymbomonas tetramitiformis]|uniref:glucan endo-1,3-beta-D-glucosidase n=1 Tax=Cymbomonas tetramitiformis TaxID=36881 RepID=A0AAE0BKZ8_9CHLO|nr:hypothetical protein CYMTET_52055 [Cymbomonas tetramitiformis]
MFLKHVLIPLVLLGESARAELCADSSCPDAYAVSNKAPWGDYVCGIGLTVGNHATFGESPNVTLCRSHDGDGLADFVFHHSHHSHKRAVEVKGHFEDISRVPLIVIWPSATSPPDLAGWTEAQLQLRGTAPSSPQALMISHVPRRPPGYPDECHLWYSWGDVTTWVLMRQRWVWGHLPTSGPVAAVGEPPAATPCSAKFDCPSEYAIDHGSTFGDYLCGITTEWGYEQPNGEYLPPPLCSLEDCAAGHAPSGAWLAQLAGNFRVWKPEVVIWRSGSQKPDGAKKDQMKLTLGSSTSKSIKVVGVPARPSGWPEVGHIWYNFGVVFEDWVYSKQKWRWAPPPSPSPPPPKPSPPTRSPTLSPPTPGPKPGPGPSPLSCREGHFDCPSDYATAHMSAAGDVLCGMTDKWGYQQKDASYLNPPLCEADVFVSGSTTGYDWLYQVAGTFLSLSDPSWSLEIAIWRSATQAPVGSLGAMRIGDTTTSTLFSLKIMSVPDRPPGWPETCYLWRPHAAGHQAADCPHQATNHSADRAHQAANHGADRPHQTTNHGADRAHQAANHGADRPHQTTNHGADRAHQAANRQTAPAPTHKPPSAQTPRRQPPTPNPPSAPNTTAPTAHTKPPSAPNTTAPTAHTKPPSAPNTTAPTAHTKPPSAPNTTAPTLPAPPSPPFPPGPVCASKKEFDCPSKEALKHEDPNSPKGSPYYICGITTKYGYETERGAHLPPPLCELAGCITQVMSPGAGAWVAQVVGSFSGNVGGALPLIVIWNSSTTGPTGDTFATAMLGLWDFSQNSTSSSLKVNKIPPKPKGWGMTSYIWCSWGDTASWWLLQEWVWPSDRPTHFRSLPVGGADWAGAGAAYVQLERVAPSLHGTHIPAGAEYVDIVNPGTAVYGTYGVNEETNPAGGAARSHSWASPMTFSNASSQAKYWTARGEAAKVLRPKPVFADPVTFLYSTQPVNGDGGYSYHNYNWLLQAPNDPGAFHPESLYGAGFHVGLPAGTTKSGVLFSTGTSQSQYVFGTRASHDGAPVDLGQDTAGVFRDAFVVYPEEPRDKGIAHVAEWLPDNPETRSQGDTDLVIRAADPARPTAVYMEVAIAQGSPFAQFESAGSMSIVVGAVFPGALATGFKTPLEPAVLLGVNGPASAPFKVNVEGDLGGVIMYQILYQQIGKDNENLMDTRDMTISVWASVAVMWEAGTFQPAGLLPLLAAPDRDAGARYFSLIPQHTDLPARFVVTPLPNQMANRAAGTNGMPGFDATAARAWAEALAPYAFNYHTGAGKVEFYVGKNPDGGVEPPNEVHTVWTPALTRRGPAMATANGAPLTVSLLQPLHYSTKFNDGRGGKMPLNVDADFTDATSPFLSFAGDTLSAQTNKYWIPRGLLEAYVTTRVHCTLIAPALAPFFPSEGAGGGTDTEFSLNDLMYMLISGTQFPQAQSSSTGPAGSSMYTMLNDPYGSGQGGYYTAKMLHQLHGLRQPAKKPEWYPAGSGEHFELRDKETMESQLMASLKDLFTLFWEKEPGDTLVGADGATQSYTYAFYEESTHHLTLYPAGTTATVGQPQSVMPDLPTMDAFGVATKMSDHNYAYGYHIAAAALLALAEKADMGQPGDDKDWHTRSKYGPAVDMLIQDLAYVAELHPGREVDWWVDRSNFKFARLEYMDTWTGLAFTDAFAQHASGKQHNANQEAMLPWAAMVLWGRITERPALAELGTALLALATYASDAYFLDTANAYAPADPSQPYSGDFGADGGFLPRAGRNFPETTAAQDCWNAHGSQEFLDPDGSGRGTCQWQKQPHAAGELPTSIAPAIYQHAQMSQGEDGGYPLAGLFNIIVPLEPMLQAVLRDIPHMRVVTQNIQKGTGGPQPYFPMKYASVLNVLLQAVGGGGTGIGSLWAEMGPNRSTHPEGVVCGGVSSFDCRAFAEIGTLGSTKSPYEWYWHLLTGGRLGQERPLFDVHTIANSNCSTQIVEQTFNPLDMAGTFVTMRSYQQYGTPQLGVYPTRDCDCHLTETSTEGLMGVALLDTEGATWTFFMCNLGQDKVTDVVYHDADGPVHSTPIASVAAYGYNIDQRPNTKLQLSERPEPKTSRKTRRFIQSSHGSAGVKSV